MKKRDIIIVCVLSIIFISMLFLVRFYSGFDEAIYNFISSFRGNVLDTYFSTITHLGDPTISGILIIICLVLFNKRERVFLLICVGLGLLSNSLLKNLICRTRPDHLRLVEQGGYSFPSGHSMISICFYGLLMYLIMTKVNNKVIKIISMIVFSVIVISIPISRVYVGVHYPTDVIAGLCLGGIVLILSIYNINNVFGGNNNEKSRSK